MKISQGTILFSALFALGTAGSPLLADAGAGYVTTSVHISASGARKAAETKYQDKVIGDVSKSGLPYSSCTKYGCNFIQKWTLTYGQ